MRLCANRYSTFYCFWGGDLCGLRSSIYAKQIRQARRNCRHSGRRGKPGHGFTRTWQRPPTQEELRGWCAITSARKWRTRRAVALGLDRDDTIVRRRLQQKLEFVSDELATRTTHRCGIAERSCNRMRISSRQKLLLVSGRFTSIPNCTETISTETRLTSSLTSNVLARSPISVLFGDPFLLPQSSRTFRSRK